MVFVLLTIFTLWRLLSRKKKCEKVRSTKPTIKGLLTASFATGAAVFLLLLAGLSLAGVAAVLVPLFLLFSPVLVPLAITANVLAAAPGGGAPGGGAPGGGVFAKLDELVELLKKLNALGADGVAQLDKLIQILKKLAAMRGSALGGAPPSGSAPGGGAPPGGGAAPAAKPETKPDSKPEAKPATKPAAKPAAKPKK